MKKKHEPWNLIVRVCVCMCFCVSQCVCVLISVCVSMCISVCVSECMLVCLCECVSACVFLSVCLYVSVCVYVAVTSQCRALESNQARTIGLKTESQIRLQGWDKEKKHFLCSFLLVWRLLHYCLWYCEFSFNAPSRSSVLGDSWRGNDLTFQWSVSPREATKQADNSISQHLRDPNISISGFKKINLWEYVFGNTCFSNSKAACVFIWQFRGLLLSECIQCIKKIPQLNAAMHNGGLAHLCLASGPLSKALLSVTIEWSSSLTSLVGHWEMSCSLPEGQQLRQLDGSSSLMHRHSYCPWPWVLPWEVLDQCSSTFPNAAIL